MSKLSLVNFKSCNHAKQNDTLMADQLGITSDNEIVESF